MIGGAEAVAALLVAAAVLTAMPDRRRTGLAWSGSSAPSPTGRTADRPAEISPARRADHSVPPAVLADLLIAILDAGLPADQALEMLLGHVSAAGLVEPPGMGPVRDALALAIRTGVAPGSLVRAVAAEHRRQDAAARTRAARRLGVLIVLPVGLCLLPAFVVLTVVPLVLALL
jgi:hypothetical protein